jgi:hypothetical protein
MKYRKKLLPGMASNWEKKYRKKHRCVYQHSYMMFITEFPMAANSKHPKYPTIGNLLCR